MLPDLRYTCTCNRGFTGKHCETEINECDSAPCLNGGTCIDGERSHTCICLKGFTGDRCEAIIDGTPRSIGKVDKQQDEDKDNADTTLRNAGIAAALVVLGLIVGLAAMWICMKRKIKNRKELRVGFGGNFDSVRGKDAYVNNAYATVGDVKCDASVKDPNLAAEKDINPAVGRNVNFPTERYVSFPAGRPVKSAKEKNVNLVKETKKGVSPATGRNVNPYAVKMDAIDVSDLQEDEEPVYCEIPYVQPR